MHRRLDMMKGFCKVDEIRYVGVLRRGECGGGVSPLVLVEGGERGKSPEQCKKGRRKPQVHSSSNPIRLWD
jgi:hypothetical protein